MDYKKVYDQIIEKARPRGLDKKVLQGYHEIHHILPVCMGGKDLPSNLVALTAREHFVCHMLLWKIYPDNKSITVAAKMMANRFSGFTRTSKIYERLRIEWSAILSYKASQRKEGEGNWKTRFKDLSGKIYGRLKVIAFDEWHYHPSGARKSRWLCECSCGEVTTQLITGLTNGGAKSCGCYHAEQTSKANSKFLNLGITRETYKAYKNMVYRCYKGSSSKRSLSEASGTYICDSWLDDDMGLNNFFSDMGNKPEGFSLFKDSSNKCFSEESCRWKKMK